MNIDRLEKDLEDQIKELQIKLGYARESMRLYYKVSSLATLVGSQATTPEELCAELQNEQALSNSPLGALSLGIHQDRIEITIPPQGAQYVHEHVPTPPFLADLINLFLTKHHPSKEEILSLFAQYSSEYVLQDMPDESDFDFGVYFIDATIDPHHYCFKEEMGHMIYHRFLKEDYEALLD